MSKFSFRPKKSGANPNPEYRPPVGFSVDRDTVPKGKYDELKDKYDRLLENAGYMAEALKNYEAVDVVRCKECKFLGFKDFSGICRGSKVYGIVQPNDYCSWGERKDNETD